MAEKLMMDYDSKERVALELMHHISNWENITEEAKRSREYWLKLYSQCFRAAVGVHPSRILKEG